MSFFRRKAHVLTFSYIGRKAWTAADSLERPGYGLFIGAVTGPDADGMPAFSEPMAAVEKPMFRPRRHLNNR